MAEQHAVLIGGTGYQYGDSDFLEYSERLYLDVSRRLHEPTAGNAPVAVGTALVQAKQDYLSGLSAVSGIDQKAMLEASLYGLPMTGFDAPGRTPIDSAVSNVRPGAPSVRRPRARRSASRSTTRGRHPDHVVDQGLRGRPDRPRPDRPAPQEHLARGPRRRDRAARRAGRAQADRERHGAGSGAARGGLPQRRLHRHHRDPAGHRRARRSRARRRTRRSSPSAFFPQRLITPNYFGTLSGTGRTSLILTPGQYRSDTGPVLTDTQRAYSHMDMRLFYSGTRRSVLRAEPAVAGGGAQHRQRAGHRGQRRRHVLRDGHR